MAKGKSRPKRWAEACAACQDAVSALLLALEDLKGVQEEYQEWKDSLPENLEQSTLGEKLEEVCSLDIEGAIDSANEIDSTVSEAEGTDLPLGFGRD